jgi:hypothetical protein
MLNRTGIKKLAIRHMFGDSRIGGFISNFSRIFLGKRMIIAKSRKDLDRMREAGELIADVREAVREMIAPGVTRLIIF